MDPTEIWDRLQRLQTDFCIAQELPSYYTSSAWDHAETVMDLGTGNGYYLRHIASLFTEKTYFGIDTSKELIEIAQRENPGHSIHFNCCDLFDVTGTYDFVVMRLLLQHLDVKSLDAIMDKIADITKPGGSVLVIDAYDPVRFYYPNATKFMNFFKAYREQQASLGLDRDIALRLQSATDSHPRWRLGDISELVIPSTLQGNLELFRKTYGLVIELVEQVTDLDYAFEAVKSEWRWWCSIESAYTQVGLKVLRLDRV